MTTQNVSCLTTTAFNDHPLHCPCCGARVLDVTAPGQPQLTPCPHTLYIASDEGFEYIGPQARPVIEALGIAVDGDMAPMLSCARDNEAFDEGFNALTDRVTASIDDAFKLELGGPAPAGLAVYVGFAPAR
ncbi:hypothetical protein [Crenobacter intestini]|uniref:Uncharacterized protein n=1 Tax=Crenobacter intestini TaxID=2563443 RepID=A0A4V6TSU4_9NEIS|nr:hypothetical protein [Crenobacter intestini]TIC80313.1 hypothetical protein E5K04_12470 [Crenobacter intestini]